MNIQNENSYITTDFYLATCIIASGYILLSINRSDSSKLEFVLSATHEQAAELIQQHWSKELIIPTKNLIEAIKELKTRMYQQ